MTTGDVDKDSAENEGRGLHVSTKGSGGNVFIASTVSKIASSVDIGTTFPSKTSSI